MADPELASAAPTSTAPGSSYYQPQNAAGGAQILEWGAQALTIFSELFGPYPYATLDLVAVPGVVGYEFLTDDLHWGRLLPRSAHLRLRPGAVEFLVAARSPTNGGTDWSAITPIATPSSMRVWLNMPPSCISSDSTGWKPQSDTSTGAYVFRMQRLFSPKAIRSSISCRPRSQRKGPTLQRSIESCASLPPSRTRWGMRRSSLASSSMPPSCASTLRCRTICNPRLRTPPVRISMRSGNLPGIARGRVDRNGLRASLADACDPGCRVPGPSYAVNACRLSQLRSAVS